MAAEFSLLPQADHLRVEISGAREPGSYVPQMVAGWRRVAEECRARSEFRILCINRLTGPAPGTDAYEIAKTISSLFAGTFPRLALVVLGDAESRQANRFAEDVTVNRGVEGRIFPDEAAALAWLRAG